MTPSRATRIAIGVLAVAAAVTVSMGISHHQAVQPAKAQTAPPPVPVSPLEELGIPLDPLAVARAGLVFAAPLHDPLNPPITLASAENIVATLYPNTAGSLTGTPRWVHVIYARSRNRSTGLPYSADVWAFAVVPTAYTNTGQAGTEATTWMVITVDADGMAYAAMGGQENPANLGCSVPVSQSAVRLCPKP